MGSGQVFGLVRWVRGAVERNSGSSGSSGAAGSRMGWKKKDEARIGLGRARDPVRFVGGHQNRRTCLL